MLNFRLEPDTIGFTGIAQFTKEQAVQWLEGEERLALAIAQDADGRGLPDVGPAFRRAEACAVLRTKVQKDRTKKVFDLGAELGVIQDSLRRLS